MRHCFFHDASAFDDLRQKHLSRPEKIADNVHAAHQRPFDHGQRLLVFQPRFFNVLIDVVDNAFDQSMFQTFFNRAVPPGVILRLDFAFFVYRIGECEQSFGGIRSAIQQDVFDKFEKIFRDFFVHGELAGIDDSHVESRSDRVIEKCRMHGFAHGVVAAERKRNVADAAADFGQWQLCFDLPRRFNEINGVVVVFFNAGGNGQNIRIENDVLRGKPTSSVRMR